MQMISKRTNDFTKKLWVPQFDEIIIMAKEELKHLAKVKKINKGFENLDDYTRGYYEGRIMVCKQVLKIAGSK